MAIFLDNGLGGGASKMKAKTNSLTVHADLLKFGFVINEERKRSPYGSKFRLLPG